MIIWQSTDMVVNRDEDGVETVTWLNPDAVGARLDRVDPKLTGVASATKTDIEIKLANMVAGLETDLGKSTDPAGSTTINAILNQTNAQINANAATYIKALARIMRSNQRADIRATRLILRDLATPDTE